MFNLKNISLYFKLHFVFVPKRISYKVCAGKMCPTMSFRMFYLRNGWIFKKKKFMFSP